MFVGKNGDSFNNHHNGEKLGIGSFMFWAKCDNKLNIMVL